jgi:hypothetical protein
LSVEVLSYKNNLFNVFWYAKGLKKALAVNQLLNQSPSPLPQCFLRNKIV